MLQLSNIETVKGQIVADALRAMLYEVTVQPKPGLVDPVTVGPHPDMTVFTFIDSVTSLRQYFDRCVDLGSSFHGENLSRLFERVRLIGMNAERTMYAATKGVNTHKGAVFSLGIMVTAVGYQLNYPERTVSGIIKQMVSGLTKRDFAGISSKSISQLSASELQYIKYGLAGIRGEAEHGFPIVMSIGLPTLQQSQGTVNQRLLDTFMAIVQHLVDTNAIKRAGDVNVIGWIHKQADHYFKLGGSQTMVGLTFLKQLDEQFTKRNISLGGSADCLILTIFLGLRNGYFD